MTTDLVIVGGGVMGLFTAYHASLRGQRVVVLERGRIGDPTTASFGLTRSYRSDYLDADYVRLAREALRLWNQFETATGARVLVRCGCMNVAKRSITPDLASTYAERSYRVLTELEVPAAAYARSELRERFPYLEADAGYVDTEGGVVNLPAVTAALTNSLAARSVRIVEGVTTAEITDEGGQHTVVTDAGTWTAAALVVTAGHGTNDVLAALDGTALQVPIVRDRPIEAKYFTPPAVTRAQFTAESMPVIAYLDAGIYCHPIVDGLIDKVKIGYYHPPDLPRATTAIDSVSAFVEHCLPGLRDARAEPVRDVDGCDYDLVADDEFVLGAIPGAPRAYVGVGWRGTGYKFAPWVGRVLAELAVDQNTHYDIGRFDPGRFTQGGSHGAATFHADPAATAG